MKYMIKKDEVVTVIHTIYLETGGLSRPRLSISLNLDRSLDSRRSRGRGWRKRRTFLRLFFPVNFPVIMELTNHLF